jgi:hypothetical protein
MATANPAWSLPDGNVCSGDNVSLDAITARHDNVVPGTMCRMATVSAPLRQIRSEPRVLLPGRRVILATSVESATVDAAIPVEQLRAYDYILLPTVIGPRISGDVRLVWQNADNAVQLYQRAGARACLLTREAAGGAHDGGYGTRGQGARNGG